MSSTDQWANSSEDARPAALGPRKPQILGERARRSLAEPPQSNTAQLGNGNACAGHPRGMPYRESVERWRPHFSATPEIRLRIAGSNESSDCDRACSISPRFRREPSNSPIAICAGGAGSQVLILRNADG